MFVIIDTPQAQENISRSTANLSAVKTTSGRPELPFPKGEGYMTKTHLKYFKARLTEEKPFLESQLQNTHLAERETLSDPLDCAAQAIDQQSESLGFGRMVQRLREVDQALLRLSEGDFGYCEHTGEEIGLERLVVNPTARLALHAQERQENLHKHFRGAR